MTESLMKKLESFQGELAKRILKWPKHHSNTAAIVALELPTMRCQILLRKLAFLQRLLRDDAVGVGVEVLHACVDDIESVCLGSVWNWKNGLVVSLWGNCCGGKVTVSS